MAELEPCSIQVLPAVSVCGAACVLGAAVCVVLLSVAKIILRRRSGYCNHGPHSYGESFTQSNKSVLHNGSSTKFADETEEVHNSLHSLSIGQFPDKKSTSTKSWLRTVEEMNYIQSRLVNSPHPSPPSPLTGQPSPPSPLTSQPSHPQPSSATNGRVVLRPARLRVRRCSISSATASLSLRDSDSNSTIRTFEQSNILPVAAVEMAATKSNSQHQSEQCNESVPQVPSKSESRSKGGNSWLVTAVIAVSVSSNILLLLLLVFNVYKS